MKKYLLSLIIILSTMLLFADDVPITSLGILGPTGSTILYGQTVYVKAEYSQNPSATATGFHRVSGSANDQINVLYFSAQFPFGWLGTLSHRISNVSTSNGEITGDTVLQVWTGSGIAKSIAIECGIWETVSGVDEFGDLKTCSNNPTPGGYYGYLNNNDDPLPVMLTTFTAEYTSNNPTLDWTTESESNNAYWNVYRSVSQNLGQALWLNVDEMIEGAGTVTEPTNYEYIDMYGVEENTSYYYWLECVDNAGETEIYGPVSLFIPEGIVNNGTPAAPSDYGLKQNFPNPFNPDTRISFALEDDGPAQITIYNLKGNKIKTIFNEIVEADMVQSAYWDGKDDNGKTVATGVYLYRLRTNSTNYTKRMLLMK
jgi:hypothetical protein